MYSPELNQVSTTDASRLINSPPLGGDGTVYILPIVIAGIVIAPWDRYCSPILQGWDREYDEIT